ncbi:MAG TPA: S46 family peptidase [Gammaproteobacteria bacterium]|nr:S46 family peptidase [Gammaproteobacteria bacterium]
MKKLLPLAFVLLAAAAAWLRTPAALADEGMWTFDNFPSAAVKEKYGVTIDQSWLDRVRNAAVRLSSGCSASLVSGEGLVLTNHHCVRDCAQALSTGSTDYVKNGFAANGRDGERICPGMQAEILTAITDVTQRVSAAAAGKTGSDYVKARDAAIAAIEREGCDGREAKYRCQVITLYHGGQYKLYTYRKYSDVRLVFAPELQTAFFGGDPDNFNFPRYDLDFSFVRLYDDGRPIASPDHLRWSTTAPADGEPVFVVGNPGTTQRLLTADQLETLRDLSLPHSLILLSERRGRLIRFREESGEHARIAEDALFGTENSFKAYRGMEKALLAPGFIEARRNADSALKAKVSADPKLAEEIGDPWAEIAAVQTDRKRLYFPYTFLESSAASGSELFGYARALVRAAEERPKPNGERLPEYTDSRLPLLEKRLLDEQPVYPELEALQLEFWLSKLREYLTADSPATQTFLGKDSPEDLAAALSRSKLSDAAYRKQLWDGGRAAVEASEDPMIRFVLKTDEASRAVRKEYEARVEGPTDRAAERIAKARFAIFGTSTYPDATFSLRISYGKIAGWTENGVPVAPFTYLGGLWKRATGKPPYDLAPKWIEAERVVDPGVVFDMVSDNDIVGGNSGSPLIDANMNVVGAIFDGNIESLGGTFLFDPAVNRAVSVSTAAITEGLRKVYRQDALLAELTGDETGGANGGAASGASGGGALGANGGTANGASERAASASGAAPANAAIGIDVEGMDRGVVPGDDFYAFANGRWQASTEIPADRASTGTFFEVYQQAERRTADVIRQAGDSTPPAGSDARKVADYYAAFMDEGAIERRGLEPLDAELSAIDAISSRADLARVLGSRLRADVDPINNTDFQTDRLFGLFVAQGLEDPSHNIAYLLQGGLAMPSRDYYLSDDASMQSVRDKYRTYVAALLRAAGSANAETQAGAVLDLETQIAAAQTTLVESEDVHKANTLWAPADFPAKAPGLDWSRYFEAAGLADQERIDVWQPDAIPRLAKLVADAPLAAWKALLRFHTLDRYAPLLPKTFADLAFDFHGRTLQGVPEQQERWKRAVSLTNADLGEAVGRLYAEKYFSASAKAEVEKLVANLRAAFNDRIDALDWMTPATKEKAKAKLAALRVGVGYPDTWRDYSSLEIRPDDALGNHLRAERHEIARVKAKLGRPVDRGEWWMTPQTVNAVNLPLQNALNFPAAILEPPFFDANADPAANYGAIGAVIGHEISHSFDNFGAEFDAQGRLVNWWTPEDAARFKAAGDALVAQYDAYEPLPGLHVNGRQTLGENIADEAGLSAAYLAYRKSLEGQPAPVIEGLKGEQRFFIAYAQTWRTKMRDAALRQRVTTDVHAPARFRAATVRNLDGWYDAFDVEPGAALYLAPDHRVQMW